MPGAKSSSSGGAAIPPPSNMPTPSGPMPGHMGMMGPGPGGHGGHMPPMMTGKIVCYFCGRLLVKEYSQGSRLYVVINCKLLVLMFKRLVWFNCLELGFPEKYATASIFNSVDSSEAK